MKPKIAHLSPAGKALFNRLFADYLLGPADLVVLRAACESHDRAEAARKVIDKEGMTFVDNRKAIRPHPLLAVEKDARTLMARLLRDLNLKPPGELSEADFDE